MGQRGNYEGIPKMYKIQSNAINFWMHCAYKRHSNASPPSSKVRVGWKFDSWYLLGCTINGRDNISSSKYYSYSFLCKFMYGYTMLTIIVKITTTIVTHRISFQQKPVLKAWLLLLPVSLC